MSGKAGAHRFFKMMAAWVTGALEWSWAQLQRLQGSVDGGPEAGAAGGALLQAEGDEQLRRRTAEVLRQDLAELQGLLGGRLPPGPLGVRGAAAGHIWQGAEGQGHAGHPHLAHHVCALYLVALYLVTCMPACCTFCASRLLAQWHVVVQHTDPSLLPHPPTLLCLQNGAFHPPHCPLLLCCRHTLCRSQTRH